MTSSHFANVRSSLIADVVDLDRTRDALVLSFDPQVRRYTFVSRVRRDDGRDIVVQDTILKIVSLS